MNRKCTLLIGLLILLITVACSALAEAPAKAAIPTIQESIQQPTQPGQPEQSPQPPLPAEPLQSTQPPQPIRPLQPEGRLTETLFPEKVLHTVIDENKAIEAVLPEAWSDMRSEPWLNKKNQPIGTTFLVANNIDAFLNLKAEGVSISVTRHPETGYIQLLEDEVKFYKKFCEDTYKTTWTVEHPVYKGKYVVLGCSSQPDSWLSVYTVVSKKEPGAYVARVIALDMVPTYGDSFRDIIMQFKVFPENLP